MKSLHYSITIDAPPKKVWDTMLGADTYREWTSVSWPGSRYEGEWTEGSQMKFIGSEEGGGTLAKLTSVQPYSRVHAEHIAVIGEDGREDRESDVAKSWIGTTERYTFNDKDGSTELVVDMETYPEWEAMFNDGWPGALQALKTLCEKS
jgi:uncharacterized protein YndB with AHSA1/START domain